jgi:hypothetical protein
MSIEKPSLSSTETEPLRRKGDRRVSEINAIVRTIQTGTSASIAAVARIGTVINEISGIQGSIASAIEQQAAATRALRGSLPRRPPAADASPRASPLSPGWPANR